MSMYNMVLGHDPRAPLVLALLGLEEQDFGRIRDGYVQEGCLAVLTRCGGNNRQDYTEVFQAIAKHPLYSHDADDEFDPTYCTFFFRFPKEGEYTIPDAFLDLVGRDRPWAFVAKLKQTPAAPTLRERTDAVLKALNEAGEKQ